MDAAYGGAVILSEMYGTMLRGIEQADSITVDPHKWFYMPFSAGGILVRDGDFLRQSFLVHPGVLHGEGAEGRRAPRPRSNGQGRRVIPDQRGFHMGDKVNFFQYGIQGSRRFNALKLWLAFRSVGRRQYAAWVEKDIELARIMAGPHAAAARFPHPGPQHPGHLQFPLGTPGPRRRPAVRSTRRTTSSTASCRSWSSARATPGSASRCWTGRVALRVNVENRCMEQSDIERLVQVIRRTADRILAEQPSKPLRIGSDGGIAMKTIIAGPDVTLLAAGLAPWPAP